MLKQFRFMNPYSSEQIYNVLYSRVDHALVWLPGCTKLQYEPYGKARKSLKIKASAKCL